MRSLKFCSITYVIFFVLFLTLSCGLNPVYVHPEAEWNYLIYMAADNNLERFALENIKELQKVGSNKKVNFLVLLDRSPKYKSGSNDWSGTKLLYISKNPHNFDDDVILSYNELDMTDDENLYNFLVFANTYFPSKYTVLNLWSHGSGVSSDGKIPEFGVKSIIQDWTTGYDKSMAIVDLKNVINRYESEANKRIDVLHFDACDMQMLEVAYELKDTVDYLVGSETEMPALGSNYEAIGTFLLNNPLSSAEEVATYITESSYEKCKENPRAILALTGKFLSLSTIRTDALDEFVFEFNKISDTILLLSDSELTSFFEKRLALSVINEYPEFCDLKEFLVSLQSFNIDVFNALSLLDKIVTNFHTVGEVDCVSGISINIPYTKADFLKYADTGNRYRVLQFYKDTSFAKFLTRVKKYLDIQG